MREEFSAERSSTADSRYINIQLNTPGYRTGRPAWKMLAWHITAKEKQNERKQGVLDGLTDTQKQTNTTRGSTLGLINTALGNIIENRVALRKFKLRKRGSKRATRDENNALAAQPIQPAQQVPSAPQAP
ncbi:MAG: hypothetical protein Q9161_008661 [Pseudevernia consocians]